MDRGVAIIKRAWRCWLASLVCTGWLLLAFSAVAADEGLKQRQQPTLKEIEPDTADLPDSAFPVPLGIMLFETSLTNEWDKRADRTLSTATLLRLGIARNGELRLSSDGWVWDNTGDKRHTGVSDLVVGFKRHLFPEQGSRPALGMIFQVKTPTASAGLGNEAWELTVFFNFGKELPADLGMEWNLGASWLKDGEQVE